MPGQPAVSIVVPTYQEAVNLRRLVNEIAAALEQTIPDWELIIVDDDSRDGCVEICQALRAEQQPVRLAVRTHARGLSSAVVEGFRYARAPVLLVMDADLSHPASVIPDLYAAILEGAEFAIGSRYVSGGGTDDRWNHYRWLNSKVAAWLARPLIPLSDPTAGFFAFPHSLLGRCESLNPIGYKIALEILIKSRATHVREIPIQFRTRQFGKSKLKLRQQLLYLRHLVSLYRFKFWSRSRSEPPYTSATAAEDDPQPTQHEEKILR